ncbi:hypothetical protein TYRP_004421 [Tyrophagus putrescentiae]|nr:hypothetical protein TYRP_004421 [Tyrophagus putrescentiae]
MIANSVTKIQVRSHPPLGVHFEQANELPNDRLLAFKCEAIHWCSAILISSETGESPSLWAEGCNNS